MAKFKDEHPDYFNILGKQPKEPRQPVTIYKDEHFDAYTKAHPKVSRVKICSAPFYVFFFTALQCLNALFQRVSSTIRPFSNQAFVGQRQHF